MADKLGAAEVMLRDRILERYRSVRAFAMALEVPCSTINNVLRRGVASVNLSTAGVLCEALGLDIASFVEGRVETAQDRRTEAWEQVLLESCRRLDNHGRELVALVASKEEERCKCTVVEFPPKQAQEGWQQYVGAPIACRGGGVRTATEEDAKQMERIYSKLIKSKGAKDE